MKHFYTEIDSEVWFDYQDIYKMMVQKYPDGSHFLEVGAWKGMSACFMAVEIINSQKNIKFDCVDTWEYINTQKDIRPHQYENLYETFKKNIEPVKDYINEVRLLSHKASELYEDNTLDFVYIDGAHDYDSVKLDLQSWFPKLKNGGTIAGTSFSHYPVKKAVDEFFGKDKIKMIGHSWSLVKSGEEVINIVSVDSEPIPYDYEKEKTKVKNNILVSTISFINKVKSGSEIYTTFAKRLVEDVLTKTPYDVMVSTNGPEFFEDYKDNTRVIIKHEPLIYHKTHVGAFNQLLKFYAIKFIDKKYGGLPSKWSNLVERYSNVLTDEEIKAYQQAYKVLQRQHFTAHVLECLLEDPVTLNSESYTINTVGRDPWGSSTLQLHQKAHSDYLDAYKQELSKQNN